jgi:polyphosphate kinase
MLEIQWSDNVKARVMDADQKNNHRSDKSKKKVRSQETFYNYLKGK